MQGIIQVWCILIFEYSNIPGINLWGTVLGFWLERAHRKNLKPLRVMQSFAELFHIIFLSVSDNVMSLQVHRSETSRCLQ